MQNYIFHHFKNYYAFFSQTQLYHAAHLYLRLPPSDWIEDQVIISLQIFFQFHSFYRPAILNIQIQKEKKASTCFNMFVYLLCTNSIALCMLVELCHFRRYSSSKPFSVKKAICNQFAISFERVS